MSTHTLTIYDPVDKANREVGVTIDRSGALWNFEARFTGDEAILASGRNVQAGREDEVLALALQCARDARNI